MPKGKPLYRPWAVLVDGDLACFGNGAQFQLPLFHSRREAFAWKRAQEEKEGKDWIAKRRTVVRVEVHHA